MSHSLPAPGKLEMAAWPVQVTYGTVINWASKNIPQILLSIRMSKYGHEILLEPAEPGIVCSINAYVF